MGGCTDASVAPAGLVGELVEHDGAVVAGQDRVDVDVHHQLALHAARKPLSQDLVVVVGGG
jgi:hypothetical protein